jgi:RNA:NAD 2'-phosphotransferase (TPT1/KptA family)
MILYHYTKKESLKSILRDGLKPNRMGIVYLTPDPEKFKNFGDILLEVETGCLELTCFEDCKNWEVLCWGLIPPKNIKIGNAF